MSEFDSLRTEIVESEKARIDLLKYKLVAIAALGSIGLGFGAEVKGPHLIDPAFVLCIVPIACAYIDLLCWHNTLRILVIAKFLQSQPDPYEAFIARKVNGLPGGVRRFFDLEDAALFWSTFVPSLVLLLWGAWDLSWLSRHVQFDGKGCGVLKPVLPPSLLPARFACFRCLYPDLFLRGAVFFLFGALGILSFFYFQSQYVQRRKNILDLDVPVVPAPAAAPLVAPDAAPVAAAPAPLAAPAAIVTTAPIVIFGSSITATAEAAPISPALPVQATSTTRTVVAQSLAESVPMQAPVLKQPVVVPADAEPVEPQIKPAPSDIEMYIWEGSD
jgi:hypothetical protein